MPFPARITFYSPAWSFTFWVLRRSRNFTLPTLSLDQSLPSVPLTADLMISICMMATCLKLTRFAFPSLLFVSCFCKSHMEVVSWVTLDERRHTPCSQPTTIGQECTATWNAYADDVQHAYKLSLPPIPMVFTCLCPFHMHLGRT